MIHRARPQVVSLMLMIVTGVALLFMGVKGTDTNKKNAADAASTEAKTQQEVIFAQEDTTNFFFAEGVWEGKSASELRYYEFYPEETLDESGTTIPEHADWAGLIAKTKDTGTYEDGYRFTGRFVYKNSGIGLPFECISHGVNLTFHVGNSYEKTLHAVYTWKSETSGSLYWQDGTEETLTYMPDTTMKEALASETK